MGNWIRANYHGTHEQHARAGIHNKPMNLDHVATFYMTEGSSIVFIVPTKDNILWDFINDAIRDAEYARIDGIIIAQEQAINQLK